MQGTNSTALRGNRQTRKGVKEMKRKTLSFVLSLLLLFGSAAYLPQTRPGQDGIITASADISGDYEYEENDDGTLQITKYKGSAATVAIPAAINGKKVTRVGENSFLGNKTLRSVTVPGGVTEIGDHAFAHCSALTKVVLPNSLKLLEMRAFMYCNELAALDIPKTVNDIGCEVFEGTKWLSLQQAKDPMVCVNNVLVDGTGCKGKVNIPANITIVAEAAFRDNKNITAVSFPKDLVEIRGRAFRNCTGLKEVVIPDNVTEVEFEAFQDCTALVSATIGKSVKELRPATFFSCKNLKKVTFRSWMWIIYSDVFYDCNSLEDFVFPDDLQEIGRWSFVRCNGLKSVSVPETVYEIGNDAFAGCLNIEKVMLSERLETIGDYAFYQTEKLKSIVVPDSVKSIGEDALGYTYDQKLKDYCVLPGFKLYCSKGSKAEAYAKQNGLSVGYVPKKNRLYGYDRYGTAADISLKVNTGSETVILANGLNYADALAGVPLAAQSEMPILLTAKNSLPDDTRAAIKIHEPKKIILLGGEGVIGKNVITELKKLGIQEKNITRIAGDTRYSTAVEIAKKLTKAPGEIFFVYGLNYPDALSAGAAAGVKGAPILYLGKDSIDSDILAYLKSIKGSVKKAYVIGGSGIISDAVLKQAGSALGLTVSTTIKDKAITRIAGANRYDTCAAVNNAFASVLTGKSICVAKGLDFPDALSGGVLAAVMKAPLFLADNELNDAQRKYLKGKSYNNLYAFGGYGAVKDATISRINNAIAGIAF